MNVKTQYTLIMEEVDEETDELLASVERRVDTESLQDLVDAFLYFLWNSGFTYVDGVTVKTTNGEVRTA